MTVRRSRGSSIPAASISARLTQYPADRLESPLDVRRATLHFSPGGKTAPIPVPQTVTGSVVRGFDAWTTSFTSSVAARRLTLGLALVALAIGMGLGALHAFAPGHGKTVMAAYLVGERGSARHGLAIGLTVAVTHTVGVLALGLALTASQAFAPESVYPWLGVASGVTFVALGLHAAVAGDATTPGDRDVHLPVPLPRARAHPRSRSGPRPRPRPWARPRARRPRPRP